MSEITVLVTGVGGGVGQSIIKGIKLANQRDRDLEYTLVGVDADPHAAGLYRVDTGHVVPMASNPDYIDTLVEIAQNENVDVLVPGTDQELPKIARHRAQLQDRAEMDVLVSPPETIEIARDKWKTHEFLDNNGFNVPDTAMAEHALALADRAGFPLVVKPRFGSASEGFVVVTDRDELRRALERTKREVLAQEYLVPASWDDDLTKDDLQRQIDEFSTELIIDREGKLVHSLANWRKMKDGVPNVARVRPYDEVREACEAVVEEMDILGPLNLQSRITDDGVTFFEINTRFTGSTAVRCVAGFNGPDAMIRNLTLEETITAEDLAFENLVEFRYKDEVYVSERDYEKMLKTGTIRAVGQIQDYM